jgi:para-nitrobenzyl esterase
MAEMTAAAVQTSRGAVAGVDAGNGITRWLGIPYAQFERGAPPRPVAPWSTTLDADTFGAACPQPSGGVELVPGFALGAPTGEPCAFLNVWAPSDRPVAEPLPVLVWIHGGSFLTGAASQAMYDGRALARRGAVIVSINYRVGPFGFLAPTPALADRGWIANAGLHDVVAALSWVRNEIAAFGGDASRVTVFGESAGAGVIVHLLGAPERRELFDRAIVQSASAGRTFDEASAALVTDAYLSAIGGVDALHDAPADLLVDAIPKVMADPAVFSTVGMMPFHPAIDGALVFDAPAAAVDTGAHAGADLLVSVTRDEMCLFLEAPSIEPERLRRRVARYASLSDEATNELLTRYEQHLRASDLPHDAIDVWGAIYTDREMTIPTRAYIDAAARHHDAVYGAFFDWSAPPRSDGRPVGAAHAIDLPFTFDALDVDGWRAFVGGSGTGAAAANRAVDAVGTAWLAHAATGDPGWPRWADGRAMQAFGDTVRLVDDPIGQRAALWDGLE